jgi:hypothetical protein
MLVRCCRVGVSKRGVSSNEFRAVDGSFLCTCLSHVGDESVMTRDTDLLKYSRRADSDEERATVLLEYGVLERRKLSPPFPLISAATAKSGAGRCVIRGQPTCTERPHHRRNEAISTTQSALFFPHPGVLLLCTFSCHASSSRYGVSNPRRCHGQVSFQLPTGTLIAIEY